MASLKMSDFTQDEIKAVYGHASNALQLSAKKAEEVIKVVGRRGKRSVEQTEVLIKEFILKSEEPVTVLQICDHIGRAPAPHLRRIIEGLVTAGIVIKASDASIGGNLPRFWYWHP